MGRINKLNPTNAGVKGDEMKDENQMERNITRELKREVGSNKVKWTKWGTTKEQVEKNLVEGEKLILLPLGGGWVSYRDKIKKKTCKESPVQIKIKKKEE